MSIVGHPRRRLLGRLERRPIVGIGPGGVLGLLDLVVDERPSEAAPVVIVLIPFAPAAATLRHLRPGTPVEVIGRAANDTSAGPTIQVVRAERITVLIPLAAA